MNMLNQIILLGTIERFPEQMDSDTMQSVFSMKVERPYAQPDGSVIYDVFPVVLWRGSAQILADHHHIGDNVAIKGRLEMHGDRMTIIAERISFITAS